VVLDVVTVTGDTAVAEVVVVEGGAVDGVLGVAGDAFEFGAGLLLLLLLILFEFCCSGVRVGELVNVVTVIDELIIGEDVSTSNEGTSVVFVVSMVAVIVDTSVVVTRFVGFFCSFLSY